MDVYKIEHTFERSHVYFSLCFGRMLYLLMCKPDGTYKWDFSFRRKPHQNKSYIIKVHLIVGYRLMLTHDFIKVQRLISLIFLTKSFSPLFYMLRSQ